MDESKTPRERAQEAAQNSAAFNAARDPVKLRKSLLHIRAAITLGLVKKADLTPLPKPASQQRVAGQRRWPTHLRRALTRVDVWILIATTALVVLAYLTLVRTR